MAGSRFTTLDAEYSGRVVILGVADTTVELRGFTMTRRFPAPSPSKQHGGCVLIDSTSPALTEIQFVGCTTCDASGACTGDGGGVAIVNTASLFSPAVSCVCFVYVCGTVLLLLRG